MTRPVADPGPDLLDKWEAADYLRVPGSTLEKWARARYLPVVRLGSGPNAKLRFRRADLDAFVAANTAPATAGPLAGGGE